MTTIRKRFIVYPILCLILTELFWILMVDKLNINKNLVHLSMIQLPLVLAIIVGRKFIFLKSNPPQNIKKKVIQCGLIPGVLILAQIILSMLIISGLPISLVKAVSMGSVIREIFSWPTLVLMLLNLPFGFSEEAAWRGYYLNLLKVNHQPLWLVDLGWWLWHISFLVRGMNFRLELWLSMPLMLIYCILLGGILRRMRQAGSGLLAVSFIHAMVNTLWNLEVGKQLSGISSIFLGPTGLVSLSTLLLSYWLYCLILRKINGMSLNVVVCNEIQ